MTLEGKEKGARKIKNRQMELEELADSDNPVSWVAEALLDAAKDVNGEGFDFKKVYAIEDERGVIKIGKSKDPERRIRSLRTGSPYELDLLTVADPEDASELEKKLHLKFKSSRLSGEWFALDENEKSELMQIMQRHET